MVYPVDSFYLTLENLFRDVFSQGYAARLVWIFSERFCFFLSVSIFTMDHY